MQLNFARFIYCIYDRNFALHYLKRLGSICVFETDRRSALMISVKVDAKSELVEDREEKSALHRCSFCCDCRLLSRAIICIHTVWI